MTRSAAKKGWVDYAPSIRIGSLVEIGGIIGLPLIGMFEAVTLDYRDGRVKFDYKP